MVCRRASGALATRRRDDRGNLERSLSMTSVPDLARFVVWCADPH
jgi:hypothetical protein